MIQSLQQLRESLPLSCKCAIGILVFFQNGHPLICFFPTCQVRVVRFYVSCLLPPPPHASCLLPPRRPSAASCLVLLLFVVLVVLVDRVVLVQLRSAIHSVRCRTSTTTIHAQCSLPDLNHDHPRPVFPAGPQPRPSPPSVPCRTSTTTIPAQCSLPDLNHDHPRPVFPAGPQPRVSTPSVPCRTSTATSRSQWALPTPNGKNVLKDVR